MPYHGRMARHEKISDLGLRASLGFGHPLVLAQMVQPRMEQKSLAQYPFFLERPIQVPTERAVAQAALAQRFDQPMELDALGWIDPVVPTLFSAIATASSSRGTRPGTMACQAGAMKAAPAPRTKVKRSNSATVIAPVATRIVIAAATRAISRLTISSSFRRPTPSASAPAGKARGKVGSVTAV